MNTFFQSLSAAWQGLPWDAIAGQMAYNPQSPMIFSSGVFLWLFAAFIVVYAMLHRHLAARLLFVTAFSYFF